ncbi:hypothetical protein D9M73_213510 [compost metagenome]
MAAQELANASDARILVDLEIDGVGAVLVEVAQRLLQFFGIGDHGAEFVHAEGTTAVARALLLEEYRPRAARLDDQGQAQQQWREHHQQQHGATTGQYAVGTREGPGSSTCAPGQPATPLHMDRRVQAHAMVWVQALILS